MTTDRRELEDWEKDECAALKLALARYNASLPKGERFTQERLAGELGMAQGNLNGHLNGKRPLGVEIAARLHAITGIPVAEYSQRLAADIRSLTASVQADTSSDETSPAHAHRSVGDDQLRDVASAISVIAAGAASGALTKPQISTLLRLRDEIAASKESQPSGLSKHHTGLVDAAFRASENDENPDDLLSMLKHGANKEHLKEQSGNVHPRRAKKTSTKSN